MEPEKLEAQPAEKKGGGRAGGVRYALLGISFLLAVFSFGYRDFRLGEERAQLEGERVRLESELVVTKEEYASTSRRLLDNIETLNQLLEITTDERNDLATNLIAQQDVIDMMQRTVESALGEVGTLQRLSVTDRELLAKYSRIYFLNENYVPRALVPVYRLFVYEPEKEKRILPEVWPFLQRLLEDANSQGIDIRVLSAYRSFGEQSILKSTYTITYGSKAANKFSADQGYSEHQLGSTVDFTTATLGIKNTTLAQTPAYEWLLNNAYRYGFILSYPKDNTYYIFEPWHWRFVGKQLALMLHESGKHFYDLPQREIDTYRVSLFDE
ncbi:MAG: M15 family metallopeptidase [bacterium]|nr:M15 family metallopeptidase [bacterium]